MRRCAEIEEMIYKVIDSKHLETLTGSTFKEGIEVALDWVLENITDEELLDE
jgi:hypothetical protein